jgi:hypothetical protein
LFAWAGAAVGAEAANPGVIQQTHKIATVHPQTWESKPVSGTLHIHVYVEGADLEQLPVGCRATYSGKGVYVWVRLLGCTKPGKHPVLARYLSVAGPQMFKLRITRREPTS